MEEYIFILIAIAVATFSAIRQSKKRKPGADTKTGDQSFFSTTANDFFRDFIDDNDTAEEAHIVAQGRIKQSPGKVPKKTVIKDNTSFTHTVQDFSARIQASTATSHIKKRQKHTIMEGFSLKKAVVYSEILQRKH